ncbi:MAG: LysE family transporter [Peptococcaceae bacterium]|nr:LysE family transporter [Peptococcaceae bacterium]
MGIYTIFVTSFVIGFSGAIMPGPLLTVTIAETTRRGLWAGPLIVVGHGILELALILALVGGLSVFLTAGFISQAIAILGGAFLLYMGIGMVCDAIKGRITFQMNDPLLDEAKARDENANIKSDRAGQRNMLKNMHPVLMGILVSISNPYWILWWVTVGLGYITISMEKGTLGLTSFFTGHILADLAWYSLISAVVVGGMRFLNAKIYSGVIAVCGVFLFALGGYFLHYGIWA